MEQKPRVDEKVLAFYYNLAEQLYSDWPEDNQTKEWLAQTIAASPLPASTQLAQVVERLSAEAVQQLWISPRQSWALAQVGYQLAQRLEQKQLLGQCGLTLGLTLSTLGRFAEAVPLLHQAATLFLVEHQPDQAGYCYSEIALACTYQDQLEAAKLNLDQCKKLLANGTNPLQQARCERAEGLLCLVQNRHREAISLLQQAGQHFSHTNSHDELILTWCDLADALLYTHPHAALDQIDQVRNMLLIAPSRIHMARCDHIEAFIYTSLNRYKNSLPLYRKAWSIFTQEGMSFLAARCDLDRGIAHYRLNQYEAALQLYQRAQAIFVTQGLESRVAMCDLNTANVYYDLNRYSEALTLYQKVASTASSQQRPLRAARCYTNMGLCYNKLGRYDQALLLHKRAQQTFIEADDLISAATTQENLAGVYANLGRYDQALAHYQAARQSFIDQQLAAQAAYCDMQRADLYLLLNQPVEARACLNNAHKLYKERGMIVHQATCDRRLAAVAQLTGQIEPALLHLKQARQVLIGSNMLVEIALCDLVEGKIRLMTEEIGQAHALFEQAKAILISGLSNQSWQAVEGLALCALARGDRQEALSHYIFAADLISRTRHSLPTERLSRDFFAGHQHVFQAAIHLALILNATEQVLELVEACKAHSFLPQHQLWQARNKVQNDPYLAYLVEQEEILRQQLDLLRAQFTLSDKREPLIELPPQAPQEKSIDQLLKLHQSYEEIVEQLRLATSLTKIHPPGFSLAAFRQAAAERLQGKWACLEYFLVGERLIIFYLDAQTLKIQTKSLNQELYWILQQCASIEPDRRELIYRGTIRGFTVPGNPGQSYRQRLSELLLPAEILEAESWDMLILAPHDLLHSLPFPALLPEEGALLERGPILYVPSLHTLQALWAQDRIEKKELQLLACGLETFGQRATALPNTRKEIEIIAARFDHKAQILYGLAATTTHLKQLSRTGALRQYDILHFASHAVAEFTTPLLSRILLADGDLSIVDILELEITARLVTFSTCHAAVGEVRAGDEMMTLARAFFHAGAQAVVASLWAVEDEATVALMDHFYRRLQAGHSIPQALRQAQQALAEAGYSPYQWASFVVIGRP